MCSLFYLHGHFINLLGHIKDETKFPSGPWCKEGDWVLITRYSGSRMRIDGGELRIITDDEILAVVDDPRDILPANIM